jgi:hypothetical protein
MIYALIIYTIIYLIAIYRMKWDWKNRGIIENTCYPIIVFFMLPFWFLGGLYRLIFK